jgi:hypothetical protein
LEALLLLRQSVVDMALKVEETKLLVALVALVAVAVAEQQPLRLAVQELLVKVWLVEAVALMAQTFLLAGEAGVQALLVGLEQVVTALMAVQAVQVLPHQSQVLL